MKRHMVVARMGFVAAVSLMFVCSCGLAQPINRTLGPTGEVKEDVNSSRTVTEADVSPYLQLFVTHDPKADVNSDGVINGADLAQFMNAVATSKAERLFLPDIEGHTVESMVREDKLSIFILKKTEDSTLWYLPIPFSGGTGVAGARTVVRPLLTAGEAQLVIDASGKLISIEVPDAAGGRVVPAKFPTDQLIKLEVDHAAALPLPPIGSCPGCVPLNPPSGHGDCIYLYSKWGLARNCLMDCYGCNLGGGHTVCRTACCFDPNPGDPDCDDHFGVPNPNH